uniref:Leucine-rich repeats and immunoglobulin-like domains 2 isoform X2 n=1 Tax=Saccoglossus kowalevskii TaxID=10224 RepID=A0ABM0M6K8_SACKO|nr:PREDICTED: leucine-rich repeats and immunoglobulin-like domains 2 isoform X2 [Saccoglossus kowalevskii]
MAAVLLYFYAAFVISGVVLCPGCNAQRSMCPSNCSCLGPLVDCSNKHLTEMPKEIPTWTEFLDLQSNYIQSLPHDAFDGLVNLRQLDLSNNELTTINGSIFENLTRLQELKIAFNSLTTIPNFGGKLINLTQLSLHHNNIIDISGTSLDGLASLRELDLNYNKIEELKCGSFPSRNMLHQLYLNNNKITTLQPGCFNNITTLEWLKLNKNKISNLDKVFEPLENLKYLELSRNKIKSIDSLAFKGLKNLHILRLKRNGISELMDGAFYGLDTIQNIHLDNNNLTVVRKSWLYGLTTLQELTLSHNKISSIEADGWDFCKELWEIDLSHNMLNSLETNLFKHLQALKNLYMGNNQISNIDDEAFMGLSSLESLDMNHNDISWTVEDTTGAFLGLEALHRLSLASNKIMSIHKRAFTGLSGLEVLDLSDNMLTSIEEDSFVNMQNLKELRINSTSLVCDCELKWIRNWIRSNGYENSIDLKCSHPQRLKGQSILNVEGQKFICEDIPKPKMIKHPKTTMALKGEDVMLTCKAESSSDSPMQFIWKKDNKVLSTDDYDISTQAQAPSEDMVEFITMLTLPNVRDEDAGKYQCIVSNHFGPSYSDKAKVMVYVFPVFIKVPQDITVKAGSNARLECAARGQPQPQIAWVKDGGTDFPAANERRMRMMPEDDVVFIIDVKPVDMGVYTCTAQSLAGNISSNATLTVLETPSFVEPMQDVDAVMGENAVLRCPASGYPKPRIKWMKDDNALDITERHFFTSENELLVIVHAESGDAGLYTCEISNTLGTVVQSAVLTVSANTNAPNGQNRGGLGLDDESTTTGIIIIAVVCCVVGTSLVWVIIIYQTRKKREEFGPTNTDETTLPPELPSSTYNTSSQGRTDNLSSDSESDSLRYGGTISGGGNRLPSRIRTAAIFPSDTEHETQTIPLTSDVQAPAENSGNSVLTIPGMPSPPMQRRTPDPNSIPALRGSLPSYNHNISMSQPHIAATPNITVNPMHSPMHITVPVHDNIHRMDAVEYPGHNSLDNAVVTHPYPREEHALDKTIQELFHQNEPPGCDSGLDLSTDNSRNTPYSSYNGTSLHRYPRFPQEYHTETTSASPHLATSTPPNNHNSSLHTYHNHQHSSPLEIGDKFVTVPSHRVLPHRTIDSYLRDSRSPTQMNRTHQESPSSV